MTPRDRQFHFAPSAGGLYEHDHFHPNRRGFDDFYGFLGGGHMYFADRYGSIYERQVRAGKKLWSIMESKSKKMST